MLNSKNKNVADYVANLCVQMGLFKVHGLMGGGASGLNDALIRNSNLEYLCYHHEQSAGYAAIGEARLTKRWAILNPTTGCGGTNAITPLLNAWQDSVPLVVISGNVSSDTCAGNLNASYDLSLRCYGAQENNIEKCVKPITKYTHTLYNILDLEKVFFKAFSSAMKGRRGPVWIDIPADIQHQDILDEVFENIPNLVDKIHESVNEVPDQDENLRSKIDLFVLSLSKSQRPLLLLGGGARSSDYTLDYVRKFIEKNQIPVVSTYASTDAVSHNYDKYLGAIGIKGNRAANFAVQNCDALLVLGSRLAFAAVGYDVSSFAKHADIFVIDIDTQELAKNEIIFKNRINQLGMDIKTFISEQDLEFSNINEKWLDKCEKTKINWEIIQENKRQFSYNGISIYHVMEELAKKEYDDSSFVVDAGSISYVAPTALHYNYTRNFIFSPAQADMGCALPSSLGVASNDDRPVYCITGDGSFMSNLQDLSVLSYHNYNVKIILLNNGGYMSISNTQKNNYGNNIYGEHEGRGLHFPDYKTVCRAFGIKYIKVTNIEDLTLFRTDKGPILFEVLCLKSETIAPFSAKIGDKQAGNHDMAPHRAVEELKSFQSVKLQFLRN